LFVVVSTVCCCSGLVLFVRRSLLVVLFGYVVVGCSCLVAIAFGYFRWFCFTFVVGWFVVLVGSTVALLFVGCCSVCWFCLVDCRFVDLLICLLGGLRSLLVPLRSLRVPYVTFAFRLRSPFVVRCLVVAVVTFTLDSFVGWFVVVLIWTWFGLWLFGFCCLRLPRLVCLPTHPRLVRWVTVYVWLVIPRLVLHYVWFTVVLFCCYRCTITFGYVRSLFVVWLFGFGCGCSPLRCVVPSSCCGLFGLRYVTTFPFTLRICLFGWRSLPGLVTFTFHCSLRLLFTPHNVFVAFTLRSVCVVTFVTHHTLLVVGLVTVGCYGWLRLVTRLFVYPFLGVVRSCCCSLRLILVSLLPLITDLHVYYVVVPDYVTLRSAVGFYVRSG